MLKLNLNCDKYAYFLFYSLTPSPLHNQWSMENLVDRLSDIV